MRQASAGDAEAVTQLVQRYVPGLRKALHGRLRPELRRRLDTEDVIQSTLALVLKDLPAVEYRGEAAFEKWLLTVATRRLMQNARFHQAARRDVKREDTPGALTPQAADRTSPSEHAARTELRRELRDGLAQLAPTSRRIVELRGLEGLSFAEIGGRMKISSHAATMRHHRALRRLADRADELRRLELDHVLGEAAS